MKKRNNNSLITSHPSGHLNPFYVSQSPIHGKGLFATYDLSKNQDLGIGIKFYGGIVPYVTEQPGSLINHSYQPNAHLKWQKDGWHIRSSRKVSKDTELTLNYSNTPWYIQGPLPHYT